MNTQEETMHTIDAVKHVFTRIYKRNGECVPFDSSKITNAILNAALFTKEFSENIAQKLSLRVLGLAQTLFSDTIPTVEDIQDLVEEVLLTSPFKKTAKAYILYRDQHARIREMVKKADLDLIDSYLEKLDWKVQENSNMEYSLQGLNNYISGEVSKTYWLNKIYTPEIREAHLSGALHLHDLGLIAPYCVGWDLHDLMKTGFRGAPRKSESGPPKHFRSALGQVVNFFYTLQGEAAGAQAFSNFDTLLAPFIRYDSLSYTNVKQAMQEFVFNINVPTRVGFQTPFTNVTIDLQPPVTLANEHVIIGGEIQPETYSEFQHEMNLFNRAFLEVMSKGDYRGRVFTFPIPTYNITPSFNWDNPELDKLWEVTAKYGIPYFANFINSELSPTDSLSMCCRLRLDLRSLKSRGGGLFGANPLTGSIGVVTVNLPQIGYLASSKQAFYSRLSDLMEIARRSLETKRKAVEQFTERNLYPFSKFNLRYIKERFGKYWHNHFSTIGIIGLNEACANLLGTDISSPEGVTFAEDILDFMRDKLTEFQEMTGHFYNLEATPAEGTSFRLAKIDKKNYPEICCANEKPLDPDASPFYTNSSQLPVNYSNNIFAMLDHQDRLQKKYTGGTVQHIFMGESTTDPQAVKSFIKKVCENYHLPYITLAPTFSICPEHGYLRGKHTTCPQCERQTEVYSRIVGYLRPVDQWNEGKQAEFSLRTTYSV